ncbi:MAG: hypothetical protein J2P27_07770 [Actinobacteria bacterium]|nr:hypothetical protein [Actinomycetota bacterium]
MTPPPTLQELIDTVRQDAGTDDPIGQLAVAAAAASTLEQTTDALLGHFVDRCRRTGRSWSEISAALGVTKQAVHKRFAGPLAERLTGTDEPTFSRFTLRARNVLAAAQGAAAANDHQWVGTEHLLLALYSEPDGIAAKVLAAMQIGSEQVEAALRAAWARPTAPRAQTPTPPGASDDRDTAGEGREHSAATPETGRLPLSPHARSALVAAVAVALELGHNYIGTEHILLALYREPDSLAARVLTELGADATEAEVRIRELLSGYSKP